VRQLSGTDFTASGTVFTFTTAPANLVGIDVYFLGLELSIPTPADVSVSTAKIVNNAVDETKLKDALVADFTEVVVTASDSILLGDATDSGNTKRDTVQGILDLAGSDYEFVSSGTGSGASSIDFTNMVTGYDYIYTCGLLQPATNAVDLYAQLGIAGPTYRTSGYLGANARISIGTGTSTGTKVTANIALTDPGSTVGNVTDEGVHSMELILFDPVAATDTYFLSRAGNRDDANNHDQNNSSGLYSTAEAHTSIRFIYSSGNLTGTIYQYRRKRS
jgi:hypothetical protein